MDLCSIASGSSGNCVYVGSRRTGVLIDAGISGKKAEEGLNSIDRTAKEMDGILITHEHSDHIKGLGVLSRRYKLPIYATEKTIEAIQQSGQLGSIDPDLFCQIKADEEFTVGDLRILPFEISHDAVQPVGYRLECEGKSAGIATDLGQYNEYIIQRLQKLNVLLLEANHDVKMLQVGRYPYYLKRRILGERGHLSNESAGQLLCHLLHDQLQAVFLGHLSKENNYEALAYEAVCTEVACSGTSYQPGDFYIQVAKREQVSQMVTV